MLSFECGVEFLLHLLDQRVDFSPVHFQVSSDRVLLIKRLPAKTFAFAIGPTKGVPVPSNLVSPTRPAR